MKEMTGWTTTEEEFDALPMAVRRKVRVFFFLKSVVSWDELAIHLGALARRA